MTEEDLIKKVKAQAKALQKTLIEILEKRPKRKNIFFSQYDMEFLDEWQDIDRIYLPIERVYATRIDCINVQFAAA